MGAYNVAKAGVIALSETLAGELAGTRVGVTVLCPTFFQTNIARSGRFVDARSREQAKRLIENGKAADDIARAALRSVERGELYAFADGGCALALAIEAPGPAIVSNARRVCLEAHRVVRRRA